MTELLRACAWGWSKDRTARAYRGSPGAGQALPHGPSQGRRTARPYGQRQIRQRLKAGSRAQVMGRDDHQRVLLVGLVDIHRHAVLVVRLSASHTRQLEPVPFAGERII